MRYAWPPLQQGTRAFSAGFGEPHPATRYLIRTQGTAHCQPGALDASCLGSASAALADAGDCCLPLKIKYMIHCS